MVDVWEETNSEKETAHPRKGEGCEGEKTVRKEEIAGFLEKKRCQGEGKKKK